MKKADASQEQVDAALNALTDAVKKLDKKAGQVQNQTNTNGKVPVTGDTAPFFIILFVAVIALAQIILQMNKRRR